jgi:hypothetical protein
MYGLDAQHMSANRALAKRTPCWLFCPDILKRCALPSSAQSVVKRYFPMRDPVGQSSRLNNDRRDWRIVGVVQDIRARGLDTQAPGVLYFSHSQMTRQTMSFWSLGKLMNVYQIRPLEAQLSMVTGRAVSPWRC